MRAKEGGGGGGGVEGGNRGRHHVELIKDENEELLEVGHFTVFLNKLFCFCIDRLFIATLLRVTFWSGSRKFVK